MALLHSPFARLAALAAAVLCSSAAAHADTSFQLTAGGDGAQFSGTLYIDLINGTKSGTLVFSDGVTSYTFGVDNETDAVGDAESFTQTSS